MTSSGTPARPRVGIIGLGNMGVPMGGRLYEAGHEVFGYDPAPAAQASATDRGIIVLGTIQELARTVDLVIMLLPGSHVVDPVATEIASISREARSANFVIDMSSSSPERTREMSKVLTRAGIVVLDAPVSGGVSGAEAGSLTIMVGGDEDALLRVTPQLQLLGKRIIHVGSAGAGHAAKALNNLLSATHLLATNEAVLVGQRFGIDPAVLNSAINTSSGRSGSTETKMPQYILNGAFNSGFTSELLAKDIGIATDLAESLGVKNPMGVAVRDYWVELAALLPPGSDHTRIIEPLEEALKMQARNSSPVTADASE